MPFKSAAVLISLSLAGSPFILKMYATVSTTFFSFRLPGSSGGIELMMVLYSARAGLPSQDDQKALPRSGGPKPLCEWQVTQFF